MSYTYEDIIKDVEECKKEKEAYERGEIDDDMSEECRKDWIRKCNS